MEQFAKDNILHCENLLFQLEIDLLNDAELNFERISDLLRKLYLVYLVDPPSSLNDISNLHSDELCTRVASLLSLWAACESTTFAVQQISDLIIYKEMIAAIFYASGFRGTAHLKGYLTVKNTEGQALLTADKIIALCVLSHIDDVDLSYIQLAKKICTHRYTALLLGWLNCRVVLTKNGELNRDFLFSDSSILAQVHPSRDFLRYVINAWMHCSYSTGDQKAYFKRNLNKMFVNYLAGQHLELSGKKDSGSMRKKPVMLIAHERVHKGHAMVRCYKKQYLSLGEYFDIYSIAQHEHDDDELKQLFVEHKVFDTEFDLEGIVRYVDEVQPDIVYYPSLGMSHWAPVLANLRLAKIQLMTLGHPDSSFSDVIDYVYVPYALDSLDKSLGEVVILPSTERFLIDANEKIANFSSEKRQLNAHEIHIAVNCSQMKLGYQFIDCLRTIRANSKSKIIFHFFPAARGFFADSMEACLKKNFPNSCVIHPFVDYVAYLDLLRQCHFSLAPFPFGNTNSTVDALLAGLPVLALRGKEIMSSTDYFVFRTVGLQDHFAAETVEQYVDTAVKMIDEKEYRDHMIGLVAACNAKETFYHEDTESHSSFGADLFYVYQHHDLIKQKGLRVVNLQMDK